jgi:sporulation protein YlmC with PRC-barrel domain
VSETADYTIGVEVSCSDGVCGELDRVVVDPLARSLTHLVVEPRHRVGMARLVPVGLVESAGEQIRLRCTTAEFDALEEAEEVRFLPDLGERMGLGYGAGHVLAWPYYGLGPGIGGVGVGGIGMSDPLPPVTVDKVPAGEVEVRRGEHVHASDGNIGRVQGLVVDPADNHVTHVLLQEGHLWGKKDVAIPISAVKDVAADGVQLDLTKDEIRDLPAVDLLHRH